MGYILLIVIIIYGYNVRRDGNSLQKTLLSCLYLWLMSGFIAGFGVSLIFQVSSTFIFHQGPKNSTIFNATLITGVIFIVVISMIAYNKSWFGVIKKSKAN